VSGADRSAAYLPARRRSAHGVSSGGSAAAAQLRLDVARCAWHSGPVRRPAVCSAVVLVLAIVLAACGRAAVQAPDRAPRDWKVHPAIVERAAPSVLYALSDVHGGYQRMMALLAASHLVAASQASPDRARWTGMQAVLVVAGDLVDKGPQSVEVVDALRALEPAAASQGGAVIVLLGNHEAEFFASSSNHKTTAPDGLATELGALGIAPADVSSGRDPRGRWLLDRPLGTRIGRWFFAHAGDTRGRSVAELSAALQRAIDADDWAGPELAGQRSLLESRAWFDEPTIGARYAAAVSAGHIVFGHDPHALGPKGRIAVGQAGSLMRIDCGMSPEVDFSRGALLRVRHSDGEDVAEAVAADGSVTELWRGAP
jgi:hypothetical protein